MTTTTQTRTRPVNPERAEARAQLLSLTAHAWQPATWKATGERGFIVPSQTSVTERHFASATFCTCKGFAYRSRCSHSDAVRKVEAQQQGAAA